MSAVSRIEELRRKLQENPRRYFAPLANELRVAGAPAEAVTLCRAHLPRHPEHLSGFIVYGQSLFDLGELTEARAVFEQALGVDPENLVALRYLGDIAKRRGDPAAARRWYERVLEADPRNDAVASQLDTLSPPPPDVVPFRPPREPAPRAVANASARRADPLPETEEDDPFAFPPALAAPEPEVEFEEGLMAPVVWPDTADLVARRLTPRALPVFAMPADEDTIAAFGRDSRDPPVAPAQDPEVAALPPAPLAPEPASAESALTEGLLVEGATAERAPDRLPPLGGGEPGLDEGDVAIDAIFGGAFVPPGAVTMAAPSRLDEPGGSHDGLPAERTRPPATGRAELSPMAVHPESLVPGADEDADEDEEPGSPASPPSAFYTETMAELLLAQGYAARAVEVFDALVAQRPGDEPLRARLRAARQQAEAVRRPHDEAAADVVAPQHSGSPSAFPPPPAHAHAHAPAVPAGVPVTARERLARLARPYASDAAARSGAGARAEGWAADLPVREPLFTGPGRAVDERVARQWAEAFSGPPRGAGNEPDAFDRLWEVEPMTDEPSLEHYFALRTPPRPAIAFRGSGDAGGATESGIGGAGA
ncbi:MAG: tetratricopeptide repeat protein [Gemmatimonadetes bacterium]|nr:tetratricopeptide repeat protein [Gemmatimonadota bacterium]